MCSSASWLFDWSQDVSFTLCTNFEKPNVLVTLSSKMENSIWNLFCNIRGVKFWPQNVLHRCCALSKCIIGTIFCLRNAQFVVFPSIFNPKTVEIMQSLHEDMVPDLKNTPFLCGARWRNAGDVINYLDGWSQVPGGDIHSIPSPCTDRDMERGFTFTPISQKSVDKLTKTVKKATDMVQRMPKKNQKWPQKITTEMIRNDSE